MPATFESSGVRFPELALTVTTVLAVADPPLPVHDME
jgi:hypothetical protein